MEISKQRTHESGFGTAYMIWTLKVMVDHGHNHKDQSDSVVIDSKIGTEFILTK